MCNFRKLTWVAEWSMDWRGEVRRVLRTVLTGTLASSHKRLLKLKIK